MDSMSISRFNFDTFDSFPTSFIAKEVTDLTKRKKYRFGFTLKIPSEKRYNPIDGKEGLLAVLVVATPHEWGHRDSGSIQAWYIFKARDKNETDYEYRIQFREVKFSELINDTGNKIVPFPNGMTSNPGDSKIQMRMLQFGKEFGIDEKDNAEQPGSLAPPRTPKTVQQYDHISNKAPKKASKKTSRKSTKKTSKKTFQLRRISEDDLEEAHTMTLSSDLIHGSCWTTKQDVARDDRCFASFRTSTQCETQTTLELYHISKKEQKEFKVDGIFGKIRSGPEFWSKVADLSRSTHMLFQCPLKNGNCAKSTFNSRSDLKRHLQYQIAQPRPEDMLPEHAHPGLWKRLKKHLPIDSIRYSPAVKHAFLQRDLEDSMDVGALEDLYPWMERTHLMNIKALIDLKALTDRTSLMDLKALLDLKALMKWFKDCGEDDSEVYDKNISVADLTCNCNKDDETEQLEKQPIKRPEKEPPAERLDSDFRRHFCLSPKQYKKFLEWFDVGPQFNFDEFPTSFIVEEDEGDTRKFRFGFTRSLGGDARERYNFRNENPEGLVKVLVVLPAYNLLFPKAGFVDAWYIYKIGNNDYQLHHLKARLENLLSATGGPQDLFYKMTAGSSIQIKKSPQTGNKYDLDEPDMVDEAETIENSKTTDEAETGESASQVPNEMIIHTEFKRSGGSTKNAVEFQYRTFATFKTQKKLRRFYHISEDAFVVEGIADKRQSGPEFWGEVKHWSKATHELFQCPLANLDGVICTMPMKAFTDRWAVADHFKTDAGHRRFVELIADDEHIPHSVTVEEYLASKLESRSDFDKFVRKFRALLMRAIEVGTGQNENRAHLGTPEP